MTEQPENLPPTQNIEAAWLGPEIALHNDTWLYRLSAEDLTELDAALISSEQAGHEIAELNQDNFHLPTLGPRLKDIRKQLTDGCGFFLIKGFPAERYNQRQAALIFFGLGTYIGTARSQNAMGHILGHVRDLGMKGSDENVRIYQTKERQTFHTDSSDVVGLICLNQAKAGGASLLVSAVTIYNEFLKRRPDLLPRLFDPIATDRRGEVPVGMKPYFQIPVFSWYEGRLTVMYQRQYIDSAQRFPDAPRLTEDHVAALDLFDELANDPALNMSMRLAPGDMQFVYNHTLLHDRMGFEDWQELEKRRHLLRLWLSVPGDRALPDVFAERFGSTMIGDRGGIVVPGTEFVAPIDD